LAGEKSGGSDVDELSKKLDKILTRLDLLEQLILEKPEYEGLVASLRLTRMGIGMYGEPLKIAARLKNAEKILHQKPIAQDDISRCIVQALAVKGPLNISGITRQVAAMRGKASRRIVRDRVKNLVEQGVLSKTTGQVPTYELVEKG
jgi:predicted DNA-binding transcriptional regulator